ncbi:hypothetical protein PIB30_065073 [Stylosanthes scabra]|uniref:Uncharacterized protein n=1 Tax=Stylosanthes scabra TaxID=79078 RepID=A0ABU6YK40_9FABA|nr:hypothetical protein [Stylosanthes scabra]
MQKPLLNFIRNRGKSGAEVSDGQAVDKPSLGTPAFRRINGRPLLTVKPSKELRNLPTPLSSLKVKLKIGNSLMHKDALADAKIIIIRDGICVVNIIDGFDVDNIYGNVCFGRQFNRRTFGPPTPTSPVCSLHLAGPIPKPSPLPSPVRVASIIVGTWWGSYELLLFWRCPFIPVAQRDPTGLFVVEFVCICSVLDVGNKWTVRGIASYGDDPDTKLPSLVIRDRRPWTGAAPPPTPDKDVADEDAEAAASAIADTRLLLIWDEHDCWDQVKKGTTEITNVFKEHYKWYAPLFNHTPDEAIDFWWEEWHKRFRFRRDDEANMRKA